MNIPNNEYDHSLAANPADFAKGKASNAIAWLMPWLFLGLRRALIPSVCLVVLAVMFYLVPQSRDILAGFVEVIPEDSTSEVTSKWDFSTLAFYLVNAVLLALAVWYAARLLCTVEAWLGMPIVWLLRKFDERQKTLEHLESPRDEKRVRAAIRWLPRAYGVAALASSMGAFIFATLAAKSQGIGGIGIVALALAAPLLFVIGAIGNGNGPMGRKRRLTMILGVVLFVISGSTLIANSLTKLVGLASIVCTLLPALLLYLLIVRRDILKKLFKEADVPEADHDRSFSAVIRQVSLFVAIGIVGLAAIAICGLSGLGTSILRHIGSAATVLLFLAFAVLLASGIQLCLRRVSRAVPGFTSFSALVVFVVLSCCTHEPVDQRLLATEEPSPPPATTAVTTTATPAVIVNAYGGGLRAAIYTAQVLALADDASCGEFGNHLRALSGVSGGSLGLAVYLAARQELLPYGLWDKPYCQPGNVKNAPLAKVVTRALAMDHLSPAIGELLSYDLIPISPPHRGIAMLESWNDALVDAIASFVNPRDAKYTPLALRIPLVQLDGGVHPKPSVFFNTTDADTGERVYFSNMAGHQTSLKQSDLPCDYDIASMSLGNAVLNSARFPIVSPAGGFPTFDASKTHRFVDGGYADNSGAQTLLADFIPTNDTQFNSIDINGNPPDAREAHLMTFVCPLKQGEQKLIQSDLLASRDNAKASHIPTALLALLTARSAHAYDAANELSDKTGGTLHPIQMNAESSYGITSAKDERCKYVNRAPTAPLGWYTSQGSATLIGRSALAAVGEVCERAGIYTCKFSEPPDLNP